LLRHSISGVVLFTNNIWDKFSFQKIYVVQILFRPIDCRILKRGQKIKKMTRLEQLNLFLEESPQDAFLLFALAREWEKGKEPLQAISTYELLVEVHPRYIGTYYHYGRLLHELGEINKALEIFERGIVIATDLRDYHALGELNQIKDQVLSKG
jgi:tetratricopeptide (TPR) repeat protein